MEGDAETCPMSVRREDGGSSHLMSVVRYRWGALSFPMSLGTHGCLPSILAPRGHPQGTRGGGAAPWPLSPSGRGAAVFVLLAAPVISAQHTQEVLSGIVHPRPDLYRKKSIKSHPSTSAATSCLCAAGSRPCRGCEADAQACQSQGRQAGMAPGAIGEHGGGAAPGTAGDTGTLQVPYELWPSPHRG